MVIGAFWLNPAVFLPGSSTAAIGPACLVFMALVVWLLMRPIRLEITETEVRDPLDSICAETV
jgi:hypothetical protein